MAQRVLGPSGRDIPERVLADFAGELTLLLGTVRSWPEVVRAVSMEAHRRVDSDGATAPRSLLWMAMASEMQALSWTLEVLTNAALPSNMQPADFERVERFARMPELADFLAQRRVSE